MPCVIKVRVVEARGLPVMDTNSQLTDAFVELHFADQEDSKTRTIRKTLNPVWNEDFRLLVNNDSAIQNEPLELRVLDYDQVTRNDSVGVVYIDLNPLIGVNSLKEIAGWFPIYDTLRGLRGELNVVVKIDYIDNANPFKDSSAGVSFYSRPSFPENYQVLLLGFVEELVMQDDPEYHWSDTFRTSRFSNEARQQTFSELAGKVRRLVGKKVREMGGNAVLGYRLSFDLETRAGDIVARAIGTACKLTEEEADPRPELEHGVPDLVIHSLRSVDSNIIRERGNSDPNITLPLPISIGSSSYEPPADFDLSVSPQPLDNSGRTRTRFSAKVPTELQLYTLKTFKSGYIGRLGGLVSARSVKLLTTGDTQQIRDAWWKELRDEIRSHARYLGCQQIVGYTEVATINDELCVLSAMGTAVTPFDGPSSAAWDAQSDVNIDELDLDEDYISPRKFSTSSFEGQSQSNPKKRVTRTSSNRKSKASCSCLHVPQALRQDSVFPMEFILCGVCGKQYVPELIVSTTSPIPDLEIIGPVSLIEGHICRAKKRKDGEGNASQVSDALPFIDHDLYKQLLYKLKVKGLNAIFDLRLQLTVGETLIVAEATGTAVFVRALPAPKVLTIEQSLSNKGQDDLYLSELYRRINEVSEKNQKLLELAKVNARTNSNDDDDSDDEGHMSNRLSATVMTSPTLKSFSYQGERDRMDEMSSGTIKTTETEVDGEDNRYNFVVNVDDATDEDLMAVLLDPELPPGFNMVATGNLALLGEGKTLQFIPSSFVTIMKRLPIRASDHHPSRQFASIFRRVHDELRFALRNRLPCTVCGISYQISLRENDVQITMVALALTSREMQLPPLAEPDDELVFEMEGETKASSEPEITKETPRIIVANHVEITPLDEIPGTKIERYLDRLTIFLVKESQTVQESGGIGSFLHSFISEAQAIARAQVLSRSGNALLSFQLNIMAMNEGFQKNQAYCLLCLSGDVVEVEYQDASRVPWINSHANWPGAPQYK